MKNKQKTNVQFIKEMMEQSAVGGLKLESLGMTRSRSPSALSILRSMGYKGNRAKVLAQVVADVAEATGVKENLNGVGSSHSQPSLSDTGVQVDGEAK
jgi:hypothetical protein